MIMQSVRLTSPVKVSNSAKPIMIMKTKTSAQFWTASEAPVAGSCKTTSTLTLQRQTSPRSVMPHLRMPLAQDYVPYAPSVTEGVIVMYSQFAGKSLTVVASAACGPARSAVGLVSILCQLSEFFCFFLRLKQRVYAAAAGRVVRRVMRRGATAAAGALFVGSCLLLLVSCRLFAGPSKHHLLVVGPQRPSRAIAAWVARSVFCCFAARFASFIRRTVAYRSFSTGPGSRPCCFAAARALVTRLKNSRFFLAAALSALSMTRCLCLDTDRNVANPFYCC